MKLYNTLNRQVKEIKPINPPEVTIYTCGPTVYDYPHIGNWFTFVRYDILVRTLKLSGYEPKWVMNITDVGHLVSDADEGEDKLEKGARREGKTAQQIADYYTEYFVKGLKRLNFTQPDYLPRATQHIPEQIDLVRTLEAKGYTYIIDDGVYYDTSKFPSYADFARLDLDEMQAGKRIEANQQKRNPSDFALWKFSPKGQQRDMEWDSPWGKGFPGWHLECSAMSMKYLGDTIDIHAGGIDHLPVHHTNEIAQSEAATGKTYANHWMHTNHIMVEGEKISKSLGNTVTLEDIEKEGYTTEALRLLILKSHYRSRSAFSVSSLAEAYDNLLDLRKFAQLMHQPNIYNLGVISAEDINTIKANLLLILQNDLNTANFFSKLLGLDSTIRREGLKDEAAFNAFIGLIKFIDDATGLKLSHVKGLSQEQAELVRLQDELWKKAKAVKGSFTVPDRLRQELFDKFKIVVMNNNESGSLWSRF